MMYALDANIVSYFLKEDEQVRHNTDTALEKGHELVIPRIVDYEVQRGLVSKDMTRKLKTYLDFCKCLDIGTIDDEVWQRAIYVYAELKKKGRMIGDGDILIAAFCLVNDCTLVTDNTKHFENIDGLKCVNWR